MSKLFYPKLALHNIKKNGKIYVPYLFASIFTIAMFFIMSSLAGNQEILEMGVIGKTLSVILNLGMIIIGFFSILILFYANNFLLKQRKQELGLYHLLGMEKKHITRMLWMETVLTTLFNISLALLLGIGLSQVMSVMIKNLVDFDIPFQLSLSIPAIVATICLFVPAFLLILVFNTLKVRLTHPIDLLKGGQQGEREPKTKWLMTLAGFLLLGIAYYLALTIKSPMDSMVIFAVAVILVMMGTYCLFIAGSIAILKGLKQNKMIYYQRPYFIAISGMIYRMKQHAAGLATICILSTMVLVTLSTTVSLYAGQQDMLSTEFPQDNRITHFNPTLETRETMESILKEEVQSFSLTLENLVSYETRSMPGIILMSVDDYNHITGGNVFVAANEALIFSENGFDYDIIEVSGHQLTLLEHLNHNKEFQKLTSMSGSMILVVQDSTRFPDTIPTHHLGFDVSDSNDEFTKTLQARLNADLGPINFQTFEEASSLFNALLGGLLFIGIFLGALFLMATGLIIYYKQLSEGYEDKERFHIMQQVGMSKEEVKKAIRIQTLMVFFLPLIVATIHLAFAFSLISKMLSLFAFTNTLLFLFCTLMTLFVFTLIYGILYRLTARTYYQIVSS